MVKYYKTPLRFLYLFFFIFAEVVYLLKGTHYEEYLSFRGEEVTCNTSILIYDENNQCSGDSVCITRDDRVDGRCYGYVLGTDNGNVVIFYNLNCSTGVVSAYRDTTGSCTNSTFVGSSDSKSCISYDSISVRFFFGSESCEEVDGTDGFDDGDDGFDDGNDGFDGNNNTIDSSQSSHLKNPIHSIVF